MATYHLSLKSGKKGTAANHSTYIARQGKHAKKEGASDLVALMHGNLPDWAQENPAAYWSAADKNERANGAAYREFELALPAELSKDEQIALTMAFLEEQIPGKPYQVAIHAPLASLGGGTQPHAHAMYSDRVNDEINRTPDQHFRRYNAKHPELGGCKKDSGGKDRVTLHEEVKAMRRRWAEVQNEALAIQGHAARVDHRSNRERGIETPPERHLGHFGVKKMSTEERGKYIDERRTIKQAAAD